MALTDERRRHVDVNGAYLHLLGYRRSELVGHHVWEFVAGGPIVTPSEWERLPAQGRFTREAGRPDPGAPPGRAQVCGAGRSGPGPGPGAFRGGEPRRPGG